MAALSPHGGGIAGGAPVAMRDPERLPAWTVVTEERRAHIARVTRLLDEWSTALGLPEDACRAWRDAGCWHDAYRDADPFALPSADIPADLPPEAWHGPAAAARLAREGETRSAVLAAIRWHTVGCAEWDGVGQALYCADHLEPGRRRDAVVRAELAAAFPRDPAAVLREVARQRVTWAMREGRALHPMTAAFAQRLHLLPPQDSP